MNAHRFINFLLDADVGAEIAEFIGYATPNFGKHEKKQALFTAITPLFSHQKMS